MEQRTQTYVYTNPRDIEGTPYEVAEATAEQAAKAIELALLAVEDFYVIARLAEMERQLIDADDVNERAWIGSPQAQRIRSVKRGLLGAVNITRGLGAAAAYDPRHPPREVTA